MNHLIKGLIIALMTFGLANCSSSGGGGGGGAPAISNAADGANGIEFTDADGNTITWTNSEADIYTSSNRPGCVFGLSQGEGDEYITQKVNELANLINSSVVGKGTQQEAGANSQYLTISYSNGNNSRTFNLNTDEASTDEETLSKANEILDFYSEMADEIEDRGDDNCDSGKGDK